MPTLTSRDWSAHNSFRRRRCLLTTFCFLLLFFTVDPIFGPFSSSSSFRSTNHCNHLDFQQCHRHHGHSRSLLAFDFAAFFAAAEPCTGQLNVGENMIFTSELEALSGCLINGLEADNSVDPLDGERNAIICRVGLSDGSEGVSLIRVHDVVALDVQFVVDLTYAGSRDEIPLKFEVLRSEGRMQKRKRFTHFISFQNGPLPFGSTIQMEDTFFEGVASALNMFAFSVIDFSFQTFGDSCSIVIGRNRFDMAVKDVMTRTLFVSGVAIYSSEIKAEAAVYNSAVFLEAGATIRLSGNKLVIIGKTEGFGVAECGVAMFISYASPLTLTEGSQIELIGNNVTAANGRIESLKARNADIAAIFFAVNGLKMSEDSFVRDESSFLRTVRFPRAASVLVLEYLWLQGAGTGIFINNTTLDFKSSGAMNTSFPYGAAFALATFNAQRARIGANVISQGARVVVENSNISASVSFTQVWGKIDQCHTSSILLLDQFLLVDGTHTVDTDGGGRDEGFIALGFPSGSTALISRRNMVSSAGLQGEGNNVVGILLIFNTSLKINGSNAYVVVESNRAVTDIDSIGALFLSAVIARTESFVSVVEGAMFSIRNETVTAVRMICTAAFVSLFATDDFGALTILRNGLLSIRHSSLSMLSETTSAVSGAITNSLLFGLCLNGTLLTMSNGANIIVSDLQAKIRSSHLAAGVSLFGLQVMENVSVSQSSSIVVERNKIVGYFSGAGRILVLPVALRDVKNSAFSDRTHFYVKANAVDVYPLTTSVYSLSQFATAFFSVIAIDLTSTYPFAVRTGSTLQITDNVISVHLAVASIFGLMTDAARLDVHGERLNRGPAFLFARNKIIQTQVFMAYMASIDSSKLQPSSARIFLDMCANTRNNQVEQAETATRAFLFPPLGCGLRTRTTTLARGPDAGHLSPTVTLRNPPTDAWDLTQSQANHGGAASHTLTVSGYHTRTLSLTLPLSATSSSTLTATHSDAGNTRTLAITASATILKGCPTHCLNTSVRGMHRFYHPLTPSAEEGTLMAFPACGGGIGGPAAWAQPLTLPPSYSTDEEGSVSDSTTRVMLSVQDVPFDLWFNSSANSIGAPNALLATVTVLWDSRFLPTSVTIVETVVTDDDAASTSATTVSPTSTTATPSPTSVKSSVDVNGVTLLGYEPLFVVDENESVIGGGGAGAGAGARGGGGTSPRYQGAVKIHMRAEYPSIASMYVLNRSAQFQLTFGCTDTPVTPLRIGFTLRPMPPPTPALAPGVVTASTVVSIASSILGGTTSAEMQTLALLGLSACAEGAARVDGFAMRSLSPFAFSESCEGIVYGNLVLAFGTFALHGLLMVVVRFALKMPSFTAACDKVRFPSLTLTIVVFCQKGFLSCGMDLGRSHNALGYVIASWTLVPIIVFFLISALVASRAYYPLLHHSNGGPATSLPAVGGEPDLIESDTAVEQRVTRRHEDGKAHGPLDGMMESQSASHEVFDSRGSLLSEGTAEVGDGGGGGGREKTKGRITSGIFRAITVCLLPMGKLDAEIPGTLAYSSVVSKFRFHSPYWVLVTFFSFIASAPISIANKSACFPLYALSASLYFVFSIFVFSTRPFNVLLRSILQPLALLMNGVLVAHYLLMLNTEIESLFFGGDEGSGRENGGSRGFRASPALETSLNFFATLQTILSAVSIAHTVFLKLFSQLANRFFPSFVPFVVSCAWEVSRWPHSLRGVTHFTPSSRAAGGAGGQARLSLFNFGDNDSEMSEDVLLDFKRVLRDGFEEIEAEERATAVPAHPLPSTRNRRANRHDVLLVPPSAASDDCSGSVDSNNDEDADNGEEGNAPRGGLHSSSGDVGGSATAQQHGNLLDNSRIICVPVSGPSSEVAAKGSPRKRKKMRKTSAF